MVQTVAVSEIDVEHPISAEGSNANLSVSRVWLFNHPTEGTIDTADTAPGFDNNMKSGTYMSYTSSDDYSAAPHYYTVCYNDRETTIQKWIDGRRIYTATNWKWSGSRPNAIVDLAVGGVFQAVSLIPVNISVISTSILSNIMDHEIRSHE